MLLPFVRQGFLKYDTKKHKWQKKKIDKLDYINIRNVCAKNDTIEKVKRQFIEWEKIISNHLYDKGLIYRIYKWLIYRIYK